MWAQFSYNIILYLIGYAFVTAGLRLSVHIRHALAFFGGMTLWTTVSLFLLMLGVPLNVFSVLFGSFLVIAAIAWFRRSQQPLPSKNQIKSEARWSSFYLSMFLIAFSAAYFYNIIYIVYDSIEYLGVGQAIAHSGRFPIPGIPAEDILHFLQARMAFLALLVAGGSFMGVEVPFTLFPITSFYLALLIGHLVYILLESSGLSRSMRIALSVTAAMLLATVPGYAFQAWFVNQNLFVGAYFSLSIMAVLIFRLRNERQWVVVAGLALANAIFTRVEISFFAALPTVLLLGSTNTRRKDYLAFLGVLLPIALGWHIFKASIAGMGHGIHDWSSAHFLALGGYAVSYIFIHFEVLNQKVAQKAVGLSVLGAALALGGAILFNAESVAISTKRLYEIAILSESIAHRYGWGAIWIATAAGLLLQKALIKDRSLDHLSFVIVLFFILRILLYSFGLFPEGSRSDYNSGSRILVHIAPVASAYLVLSLANALKRTASGA